MTAFDPVPLRALFPALSLQEKGKPVVFMDGPGGTQVPQSVIEAVSRYYRESNANVGGAFGTSRRTDETVTEARQAVADLLNVPDPSTILFGANMTSLTFHIARSFGETIRPGDEIVVTELDHDANIAPWADLEAQGAKIRVAPVHSEEGTLDLQALQELLNERTRLVAVTHASNAIGVIPDVKAIVKMAHEAGALVYVDAVQYAPHGPIDVQELDCDFLACSSYKFFGPHMGMVYGKREHLESLRPHKVRPAKNAIPNCWETGTLSHESMAGVTAAVDYLAGVGELFGGPYAAEAAHCTGRKNTLKRAMHAIKAQEMLLSQCLLDALESVEGVTLYGPTNRAKLWERTPTTAFTWPVMSPRETTECLGSRGIFCWSGNYYALRLMEKLGLEGQGGAVRVGLTHLNTFEEIDRLKEALRDVKANRT